MARTQKLQPALITSARIPQSLDTSQRTRRYVITMTIRVGCFFSGLFAPTPWNLILLVIAATLPGAAVLLANNVDHRSAEAPGEDVDTAPMLAITAGDIVPGEVEEEEQV